MAGVEQPAPGAVEQTAAQQHVLEPVIRRVQPAVAAARVPALHALLFRPQVGIALELLAILALGAGGIVLDAGRDQAHAPGRHVHALMHFQRLVAQLLAEQPADAFVAPAEAQDLAEEMRAPPQAPDVGALDFAGIEQFAQAFFGARVEPFVGIDHQHPGLRGLLDRLVLLPPETLPGRVFDPRAGAARQRDGRVGRSGIDHHHLLADRRQRSNAAHDPVGLVESDDGTGHRERGRRHGRGRSRAGAILEKETRRSG